jgi:catechol 2,3-dioxygenase-like lactoylglutathione lyase family enzyme
MIERFDHIVLTVADLAATIAFYERALGMEARSFVSGGVERWALHFGDNKINLHQAGAEFEPKARAPSPGSADICFTTQRPVDALKTDLAALNIEVIDGPAARSGARAALLSIYLRDPDGNLIEIANEV